MFTLIILIIYTNNNANGVSTQNCVFESQFGVLKLSLSGVATDSWWSEFFVKSLR